MLDKTLALLANITPGTYVPDDTVCFDRAELDQLGRLLNRLLYGPSSLRRVLQQSHGVTLTRADEFGGIPTVAGLEHAFRSASLLKLDGIFPDNNVMIDELQRLMTVSREFDPPLDAGDAGEYAWRNDSFSYSDAVAYYAMIRTRRPRTILEIGGGWHTRVAHMACARNGMGRIVTIDPRDGAFPGALEGIAHDRRQIQDVDEEYINDLLRDGDMVFIDSSHTVNHDGDCLHIYLRILPAISASVTVQVHDIFLPDTLSLEQMRDHQVFWNEQYLLCAYMQSNPRTRTLFGSRYHARRNPKLLEQFMHGRYQSGGGSLWFHQVGF